MEIVNETCRKTGAALTDITVVRRTPSSSTGRPKDIQIGSTYYDISNPRPWTLTYNNIILEMEFGKGTSGTAYACTVRGQKCVVKVPNEKRITWDGSHYIFSRKRSAKEDDRKALIQFESEFENFERIMEPEYVRSAAGTNKNWVNLPRDSAVENRMHFKKLQDEMKEMRHEGFLHMHRLLHIEILDGTPLIFSEYCDASLANLMDDYVATNDHTMRTQSVGDRNSLSNPRLGRIPACPPGRPNGRSGAGYLAWRHVIE